MDLQIRVRKQVLTCRQTVIAGSVNFVKAKFMFDDEWLGTEIHIIFSNGDIPEKEIVLDDTLECVVPWEVLETEGDLYVSAVGLLDGDVRISTKLMDNPITVYPHGSMGGSDPLPPTPTVWDELKDALPVDWNENDESKLSYIKNRTHWKEEVKRDYTVLPNAEPDPTFGLIAYGKKIGLEIGKEYTFDAYNTMGEIATEQVVIAEAPVEDIGFEGVPYVDTPYVSLYDGVDFDFVEEMFILADNCIYFINNPDIEKVVIRGLPSVEITVHKIPNEYLPKIDQTYLPESKNAQSGIAVQDALLSYTIGTQNILDNSIPLKKLEQPTLIEKIEFSNNPVQYISLNNNLLKNYKKFRISGYINLGSFKGSGVSNIRITGKVSNTMLFADFGDVFTVSSGQNLFLNITIEYGQDVAGNYNTYVQGIVQNQSVVDLSTIDARSKPVCCWNGGSSHRDPVKIYVDNDDATWSTIPIESANLSVIGLEKI